MVPAWTRGTTYATANSNKIAEFENPTFGTIVNEETLNGADSDAPNRRLPVNSITFLDAVADNADGVDLCQMLVDKAGTTILAVSNETTDRPITTGDSITSFAFFIQASQPAQLA